MKEVLNKKAREKEMMVVLVIALAFMWSGFYLSYQPDPLKLASLMEEEKESSEQVKLAEAKQKFFNNLNLEAKAYVVYNPETGEIIARQNEKKVLPLASLTKIMTVLATSDELSPQTRVTIKEDVGGNVGGLRKGESWQMANLAALTLVSSSNEGAIALAEAAATSTKALVSLMNEKAKNLQLKSLAFNNPTGLDNGPFPGGQGSALDVAKLLTYVLKNKPELLAATNKTVIVEESTDGLEHTVVNTNKIINQIPGILASKTGFTDLAGGNLAVAANIGLRRPLVFVVLGSSKEGRFSDTKKLTNAAINYYAYINK